MGDTEIRGITEIKADLLIVDRGQMKKAVTWIYPCNCLIFSVGTAGFEPATLCL